jgi:hypothetical protein
MKEIKEHDIYTKPELFVYDDVMEPAEGAFMKGYLLDAEETFEES